MLDFTCVVAQISLNLKIKYSYISTNCYTFYSYNFNIVEIKEDNITIVYVHYTEILLFFLGLHLDRGKSSSRCHIFITS